MKSQTFHLLDGSHGVPSSPQPRQECFEFKMRYQIKNEKFKLYDNGFNEFHLIGDRNDYYPKGTKDLERFFICNIISFA